MSHLSYKTRCPTQQLPSWMTSTSKAHLLVMRLLNTGGIHQVPSQNPCHNHIWSHVHQDQMACFMRSLWKILESVISSMTISMTLIGSSKDSKRLEGNSLGGRWTFAFLRWSLSVTNVPMGVITLKIKRFRRYWIGQTVPLSLRSVVSWVYVALS